MSLRTENAQLKDEVHNLMGQFRDRGTELHAANTDLRRQTRQFLAECHETREKQQREFRKKLEAEVAALRAAAREFVWGDGAPRTKGEKAAAGEPEQAPRPRKKKRPKVKAK